MVMLVYWESLSQQRGMLGQGGVREGMETPEERVDEQMEVVTVAAAGFQLQEQEVVLKMKKIHDKTCRSETNGYI